MPLEDQQKWDKKYAEGAYQTRQHPSVLLCEWIDQLPHGRAADLACGRGRNSHFLAAQGYSVDAFDISTVGLQLAQAAQPEAGIQFIQRDLLAQGLVAESRYDLIIMFRFVAPQLCARLCTHLNPGGVLMVENHLQWSDTTQAPLAGPGPRFRVAPGDLQGTLDARMQVLYSYEGLLKDPDDSTVAVAQLIAQREEGKK